MKNYWTIGMELETNIQFRPEPFTADKSVITIYRKGGDGQDIPFIRGYGDDTNEKALTLEIVTEPMYIRDVEFRARQMKIVNKLKTAIEKQRYITEEGSNEGDKNKKYAIPASVFMKAVEGNADLHCAAEDIELSHIPDHTKFRGTQATFGIPVSDAKAFFDEMRPRQEWYKKQPGAPRELEPLYSLLVSEMNFCMEKWRRTEGGFDMDYMETAQFKNQWGIAPRTPPAYFLEKRKELREVLKAYAEEKGADHKALLDLFISGDFHIGHKETIREVPGAGEQLVLEWRSPDTYIMDKLKVQEEFRED